MVSAGTKRPSYRILLVEDDADDAERVESALREAGLSFLSKRVDTRDAFVRELTTFTPDIVLSDYAVSGWSALDALRCVEEAGRHVPFVIVTRPQTEEIAVECLKAGADDYVSESNLSRLPSALRDAVQKQEAVRERAAAEAALRRTEERFRILTQYASDLICLLDGEGRFLYASPSFERHLGHPPAELVGVRADSLVHPEDLEKMRAAMEADEHALEGQPAQFRCRRRDGEWRIVEAVGETIPGSNGRAEGAVVVARDVTDRARLEEELHEAQRMEAIRRLAGGIAHDFNNLLTAIKGHTEVVLDILAEDDPLRPNLDEVKKAADRAAALTRQLVAFSRRQVVSFEEVDVNALVSRMERTIRRLLGDGIELRTALASGLGRVRADPQQIEQVIQNLVTNAREAMPRGGTLSMETANVDLDAQAGRRHVGVAAGAYVVLAVQDTGGGIDADARSAIFEPFFTTKSLGEGNGLGLSVVYGIVKQSGGAIVVEGEPGEGTTFRIYLPRVTEAETAEAPAATLRAAADSATVLLVEDDEPVRRLIADVLGHRGLNVLSARDGADAVRICESHEGAIDLLVTDVVMPDVSGLDLSQQLSVLRPEMRVLYVSGYADQALIDRGLLEEAVSFLPKPFTLDGLVRKVWEVLARPRKDPQAPVR